MSFGYSCAYCGGCYSRCGKIHDYCIRCVECKHCKNSTCKCLQCDLTGHLQSTCAGGSQCWEKEVCCLVESNYHSDLGTFFEGIYDGMGNVIPIKSSKYKYVIEEVYKNENIPVKAMCKTCYTQMFISCTNIDKEYTKMKEYISIMEPDEYNEYQNFVNDNILDLETVNPFLEKLQLKRVNQ